jgi:hypothetical protein
MQTWVALVAAFAALLGVVVNYVKTRHDLVQWEKEQRTQLEVGFLQTLVEERLRCYPPVFKLLGEVRDTAVRGTHLDAIEANPAQLVEVADELWDHVYGDAGLLMSMETRNGLLDVVQICRDFDAGEVSLGRVRLQFQMGRRLVRADLQIEDIEQVRSEVGLKAERFTGKRSDGEP